MYQHRNVPTQKCDAKTTQQRGYTEMCLHWTGAQTKMETWNNTIWQESICGGSTVPDLQYYEFTQTSKDRAVIQYIWDPNMGSTSFYHKRGDYTYRTKIAIDIHLSQTTPPHRSISAIMYTSDTKTKETIESSIEHSYIITRQISLISQDGTLTK